jgi:hypothetical protein
LRNITLLLTITTRERMTKTIRTINIAGAVLLIINMGFELHDRIKAYCQNKKQEKQTDDSTRNDTKV